MATEIDVKTEVDVQQEAPSKKKERSFGNKTFDLVVWSSIQGLGVWIFSLVVGKEATSGTNPYFGWLRTGTNKLIQVLEQVLEKPASSKLAQTLWGSSAKEWAKDLGLFTALSIGGTLSTPILKWFEHRREKIAGFIDKLFNKTPPNTDEIIPEPKQTWSSMLAGRITSVGVALATFIAIGPKRTAWITKNIGEKVTHLFSTVHPSGNKEKFSAWAGVAIFDLIYTAATATVNYVWSRLIARKEQKERERIGQDVRVQYVNAAPVSVKIEDEKEVAADESKVALSRKKSGVEKSDSFINTVNKSRANNEQTVAL